MENKPKKIILNESPSESQDNAEKCKKCGSHGKESYLRYFFINSEEAVYKCNEKGCLYPFANFKYKNIKDNTVYRYGQVATLIPPKPVTVMTKEETTHEDKCNMNISYLDHNSSFYDIENYTCEDIVEDYSLDEESGLVNFLNFANEEVVSAEPDNYFDIDQILNDICHTHEETKQNAIVQELDNILSNQPTEHHTNNNSTMHKSHGNLKLTKCLQQLETKLTDRKKKRKRSTKDHKSTVKIETPLLQNTFQNHKHKLKEFLEIRSYEDKIKAVQNISKNIKPIDLVKSIIQSQNSCTSSLIQTIKIEKEPNIQRKRTSQNDRTRKINRTGVLSRKKLAVTNIIKVEHKTTIPMEITNDINVPDHVTEIAENEINDLFYGFAPTDFIIYEKQIPSCKNITIKIDPSLNSSTNHVQPHTKMDLNVKFETNTTANGTNSIPYDDIDNIKDPFYGFQPKDLLKLF